MMERVGYIILFWVMQIVANLLFKYGANHPSKYWLGFIAGNIVGASSIFVIMKIYTLLPVNVAGALAGGGTFVLVQILLYLIFREPLTRIQAVGIGIMVIGMMVISLGGPVKQQEKASSEVIHEATAMVGNQ